MTESTSDTIAMAAPEAARKLGVSERTLWTLTRDKKVPHIRLGGRVLYPREALVEWANKTARDAMKSEAA